MLPSSTVENYLKAIYVGETHLVAGQKLVPMGQLASALGIAPGTATTMVKALAESGLVSYEPYNGVRLTAPEKNSPPASSVVTLLELFLVQIMGMNGTRSLTTRSRWSTWCRSVDRTHRRDARPPIRNLAWRSHSDPDDARTSSARVTCACPLNIRLLCACYGSGRGVPAVYRDHHLKPGQTIEVEERDEVRTACA